MPDLCIALVLEAQQRDMPKGLKDEIRELWAHYELGNDDSYLSMTLNNLYELKDEGKEVSDLISYFKENELEDDEKILIHYWW